MSIRICHISTMHQTFDTRVFKKECVSLSEAGYTVTLIIPAEKDQLVDGVQIVAIDKHRSFLDRIYSLPRKAVEVAKNIDADIYHFHDPELLPYMRGLAKEGKRVIWDAHENYKDTIKSFNSLKLKPISILGAIWFNWLELRTSKKYFSGVVTITPKMAKKYSDRDIEVCVLGNYPKVAHFTYDGKSNIAANPMLLSSGAHFRPRAIVEIAQSFQYMDQALKPEIQFSGKFVEEALESEVRVIAANLDKSMKRIVIEGELTYLDLINRAIPSAWAGTVLFDISDPNNRNGLPNRFFECWANGVPVICTDQTQVANVIRKYGGGIIIPNNEPIEIAKAFNKIASDRKFREKLSEEAFNAVQSSLSWEKNFEDLKELYNKILKG